MNDFSRGTETYIEYKNVYMLTFIHSDDLADIDYHLCTYQIIRTLGNFRGKAASRCIKQPIKMGVLGGCEVHLLVSNEVLDV